VFSFKTLHGLRPHIRYDAKHHKSTSITNGLEASKHQRKSLLLMESKRHGQNHWKKKKDHPKILLDVVKEGSSANSQQMIRKQIRTETQKPYKM
jgi:hypothetical protein